MPRNENKQTFTRENSHEGNGREEGRTDRRIVGQEIDGKREM